MGLPVNRNVNTTVEVNVNVDNNNNNYNNNDEKLDIKKEIELSAALIKEELEKARFEKEQELTKL